MLRQSYLLLGFLCLSTHLPAQVRSPRQLSNGMTIAQATAARGKPDKVIGYYGGSFLLWLEKADAYCALIRNGQVVAADSVDFFLLKSLPSLLERADEDLQRETQRSMERKHADLAKTLQSQFEFSGLRIFVAERLLAAGNCRAVQFKVTNRSPASFRSIKVTRYFVGSDGKRFFEDQEMVIHTLRPGYSTVEGSCAPSAMDPDQWDGQRVEFGVHSVQFEGDDQWYDVKP